MPGIRTFISLPAGTAEMDMKKYIIYVFAGSLIWCFILGYIRFFLGSDWVLIKPYFYIIIIIGIIGLIIYLIYKYKEKNSS